MKVLFISLGCDKNLVDTEEMLGLLSANGYDITNEEKEADAVVINTCCFIHDAKEESIENILEMAELKKAGAIKAIIVTGCLAQRYKDEIITEIPEVDAILGTSSYDKIVDALNQVFAGETYETYDELTRLVDIHENRILTTGTHSAYLRIAEGCDKHCTYCVIPSIRGRYRSVPMEKILETAKFLASEGIKELNIIAQETTIYGVDLYGEKKLPELLRKLAEIDGIEWLRLLYCYPEEITDELIEEMASNEKVCHYIDMPIQHSEDEILKRMGRKTSKEELIQVIEKLRNAMDDIVIRTTLITGFPGETKEHAKALLSFVDEMEFERLGVFTYSAEENTPAATFPNQVEEEEKIARRDAIMSLQQEIAYAVNDACVGATMQVMIEGYLAEDDVYVGRSYMDAPSVDSMIFVRSSEELISGDLIYVKITDVNEYDLIGDVDYEFTE